jgi:hypothetical protein
MQELGYAIEQIEAQIGRAVEHKLVQSSGTEPPLRSLRVMAAGSYMYKRMLSLFTYVDAVIVDTPIVDPAVRREIQDAYHISDRLARAKLFQRYLDEQWCFDDRTTFSWPVASAMLRRDIVAVSEAAERRRTQQRAGS